MSVAEKFTLPGLIFWWRVYMYTYIIHIGLHTLRLCADDISYSPKSTRGTWWLWLSVGKNSSRTSSNVFFYRRL